LRSLPLRRLISTRQPLISQNFQGLGYVAFTAFLRSQGFAPPGTSRPYFMPGPPLGFPLEDLLHPKSWITLRLSCLLAVRTVGRSNSAYVSRSISRITYCAPICLYRTSVPTSSATRPCSLQMSVTIAPLFRLGKGPRPSLGFSSLGLALYPLVMPLAIILSCALSRARKLNSRLHFRVLPTDSMGLLSRANLPFRGLSPFGLSYLFGGQGFLGRPFEII
jgi:hypothetical protein